MASALADRTRHTIAANVNSDERANHENLRTIPPRVDLHGRLPSMMRGAVHTVNSGTQLTNPKVALQLVGARVAVVRYANTTPTYTGLRSIMDRCNAPRPNSRTWAGSRSRRSWS